MLIRHDQNICLFYKHNDDISLVHYWELERISGMKQHWISFFDLNDAITFINSLLSTYELCIEDMNEVWGLREYKQVNSFELIDEVKDYAFHNICHLYSGALSDEISYDNTILAIATDGGPDGILDGGYLKEKQYCGAIFIKGKLAKIVPMQSPGLLYGNVAHFFDIREGTLMALSSASESKLLDYVFPTPPMWNNSATKTVNKIVASLWDYVNNLGPNQEGTLYNYMDPRFSDFENKVSMVMKEIQRCSVNIMEENILMLLKDFPDNPCNMYLSIAGGFALNCPTNTYLMNKFKFKGFISPPCVSDTGLSLGLGLYVFNCKLVHMNFNLGNAFYGDEDVGEILTNGPFSDYIQNVTKLDLHQAVADIIDAPVVWFNSRAEIGPRALGHRSILCDPRKISSKNKLNTIKKRQWWRPVAPIILSDHVAEWFSEAYDSPYMLQALHIKEEKKKFVEAVVHLDGTARVQTLERKMDPTLFDLIDTFYNRTGIPMLGNTSLNDRGEPIINTVAQALNFALRKGIKVVYINCSRVKLINHDKYIPTEPLQRNNSFWLTHYGDRERLLNELNPLGLDEELLRFYYKIPQFMSRYDIRNSEDVARIQRVKSRLNKASFSRMAKNEKCSET